MSFHEQSSREAWLHCRRLFARRATQAPHFAPMPQLIDWMINRGWAERLLASLSLDNLVLSGREGKLVIIPKPGTMELKRYGNDGLVEQTDAVADRLYEHLGRMVPMLSPSDEKLDPPS